MIEIIHINKPEDVESVRNKIINLIFSVNNVFSLFPQAKFIENSPVNCTNLDKCYRYQIYINRELTSTLVFNPKTSNNKLAVICIGHTGTYENFGTGNLIRNLNQLGYTILGCVMPGNNYLQSGSTSSHTGLNLSDFITPVIVTLNELCQHNWDSIICAGLSGGGWMIHLLSAIDKRILKSFPIAGAMPLDIDIPNRDFEQRLVQIYPYGFKDLMILATNQLQILHTQDDCCFNLSQYNIRPYLDLVRSSSLEVGHDFNIHWVNQEPHTISDEDINVILTNLNEINTNMQTETIIIDDTNINCSLDSSPVMPNPNSIPGQWNQWNAGYGGRMLSIDSSVQNKTAIFSWNKAGIYSIYLTWISHTNRSNIVPIKIFDSSFLMGQYTLNQQLSPKSDKIDNNTNFQFLTKVTIQNQLKVIIYSPSTGFTIVDAVLLIREFEESIPPPSPMPAFDKEVLRKNLLGKMTTAINAEIDAIRV